jgi:hypothetical protein
MQTDAKSFASYSDKPGARPQMTPGDDRALFSSVGIPDAGSQTGSPPRVAPHVRLDGSSKTLGSADLDGSLGHANGDPGPAAPLG